MSCMPLLSLFVCVALCSSCSGGSTPAPDAGGAADTVAVDVVPDASNPVDVGPDENDANEDDVAAPEPIGGVEGAEAEAIRAALLDGVEAR